VLVPFGRVASLYRRADNSRPVFFTASAWEWVCSLVYRQEQANGTWGKYTVY
jgi:hypothetical protein